MARPAEGQAGTGAAARRRPVVVHVSSVHGPRDIRIRLKQCRSLKAAGYAVAFAVPCESDDGADGVEVLAVPPPRSRTERMLRTVWRVGRRAEARDPDVVHLHDPELMPLAWYFKLRRRRVILDVHEDAPGQILAKAWIRPGLRKPAAALVALMEQVTARLADAIVAATPAIARRFPAPKTALVQNFPIPGELDQPADDTPYEQRPPHVAYVGVITPPRGAREMVRAMAHVRPGLGARLHLAGAFCPSALEHELAREEGWRHVEACGTLSRPEVARLLSRARCGLVLFQAAPNHVDAQPNKLFEYMSAGIPVIASDFPLWRSLVEDVGAGILVDPENPLAIADAITWLLRHPSEARKMGEAGRIAVGNRYNWAQEADRLVRLYAKILGPRAASPDARR